MTMPVETEIKEYNRVSSTTLIMQGSSFDRVMVLAETMSNGKTTVPKHLQNNPADCAAVIMQAMQWDMNPFAVAQKTHLVNGTLGYEAQLVNAVIQSSGSITGRFHYEYQEQGNDIGCRVGAVIASEAAIQWGEWLWSSQVQVKNSPLWKTNQKQQLGYLQIKNWARAYCPGAILGVYTPDELETITPERELNPVQFESTRDKEALPVMDQAKFLHNFPSYEAGIKSGRKTADQVITTIQSKFTLTTDQENAIRSVVAPIQGEAEVVE